jgi:hypothetical protein
VILRISSYVRELGSVKYGQLVMSELLQQGLGQLLLELCINGEEMMDYGTGELQTGKQRIVIHGEEVLLLLL